jgi:NAD(P)-dependent dehydrogenase (short-subunit alcohol dehydrogenase family)
VVADGSPEGGDETNDLIASAGGEAAFVRAEVSDAREVEMLVPRAIDLYGRLDYAQHLAGIEGEQARTDEHSEGAWDLILAINLKGVWLCMR